MQCFAVYAQKGPRIIYSLPVAKIFVQVFLRGMPLVMTTRQVYLNSIQILTVWQMKKQKVILDDTEERLQIIIESHTLYQTNPNADLVPVLTRVAHTCIVNSLKKR